MRKDGMINSSGKWACCRCKVQTVRLDFVDAYACRGCDVWFSEPCSSKPGKCFYCDKLRDYSRPSEVPAAEWSNKWNS